MNGREEKNLKHKNFQQKQEAVTVNPPIEMNKEHLEVQAGSVTITSECVEPQMTFDLISRGQGGGDREMLARLRSSPHWF